MGTTQMKKQKYLQERIKVFLCCKVYSMAPQKHLISYYLLLWKSQVQLYELIKLESNPKTPLGKKTIKQITQPINQEEYKYSKVSSVVKNIIFHAIVTMLDNICEVYSFLQQFLRERYISAD